MRHFGLVTLLVASTAAAERVVIAPFTGPQAPAVRARLATAICAVHQCVPPKKILTRGKPNWKQARKERVEAVILGKVSRRGKTSVVQVSVSRKPGSPEFQQSYPLFNGKLADSDLSKLLAALEPVGRTSPAEAPPPSTPVVPGPEAKTAEVTPRAPASPAPVVDERPARPVAVAEAPAAVEPEERATRTRPWLAVEAGAELIERNFGYAPATVTNLRSYSGRVLLAPALNLALYPFALLTSGALGGLGLDASFATALGMRTRQQEDSGLSHPTTALRFGASLRWRVQPLQNERFALTPFVGYHQQRFKVGAAADGTRLEGLPGLSYQAVRAGLEVEVPVFGLPLSVFGRAAALVCLSSGEILGGPYFSQGSAFGLDGELGIGFRLARVVELRAAATLTRYALSFRTEPSDPYLAEGAVDQSIGGTLRLRLIL